MLAERLIEIVREQLDDEAAPPLWTDETLLDFLSEAEEEACRRARLIVDSTTEQICTIALAANTTPLYKLDKRVVFVRRVRLVSNGRILTLKRTRDLDCEARNWESRTGSPTAFLNDYETGKIRFDRIPTADETAYLQVTRLPLKSITDMNQEPEIHGRWHRALLHWVRYRAYSKRDAETYDEKKAAVANALFEGEFGAPSTAQNEQWDLENLPLDALDGRDN